HPDLCLRAQAVASRLIVELCGAKLVPGTIDVAAPEPPPRKLRLRGARVTGILGMEIPAADQRAYLERMDFEVLSDGDDLEVTVPPDRYYDVTREIDLIEEVGRLHGFAENLPTTLPKVGEGKVGRLNRTQRLRRRAEDELRDLGFDQIVGWSFTDPGEASRLRIEEPDPRADPILVANPLSDEGAAMRTTLLGSLLDVAARNLARGREAVALFEAGAVYLRGTPPTEGGPLAGNFPGNTPAPVTEPHRYGALAVGPLVPKSWRGGGEPVDFYALKGVLEALASGLGCPPLTFAPTSEPFLHPGRSAKVSIGNAPLGWLGEVHPLVCRTWDIAAAVGFEIDAAPLLAAATLGDEEFEDVTTFPAARRDLAVVVPADESEQRDEQRLAANRQQHRDGSHEHHHREDDAGRCEMPQRVRGKERREENRDRRAMHRVCRRLVAACDLQLADDDQHDAGDDADRAANDRLQPSLLDGVTKEEERRQHERDAGNP
ncbi:MAG: Phenylalanine--tRNA ligase beta subunit, partial [Acidobacteria bacterium]|nr:Phenylalanine--tRNA ligase beta subunit [Acidobacteriota bacterium]